MPQSCLIRDVTADLRDHADMAALLAPRAVARVQAGADDALHRLHFGPVQDNAAPLRVPRRDPLQSLRH
eukprot:10945073-Alexandrium_andersonii.AAC.1